MPKLIVLVGPPGSGKSSLAREYTNYGILRSNQDSEGKSGHLEIFNNALKTNQSVCIDRMNFNKEQRSRYLEPAKKAGYETEIIVLHENYETCLKRCNARNDHETIRTPEDANKALSFFFKSYERPTEDEADTVTFKYPEQNLKLSTIIVDLDGTLCNTDHRQHFMDSPKKNWPGFFNAMSEDTVHEWCKKLIKNMRGDNIITLCSGRPDNYRAITKTWLETNKVFYDNLYMRPRNDSRKDDLVKEIILDFEILTRYSDVLFAVDDRNQVVEMWRKRGITCLQCAPGDF